MPVFASSKDSRNKQISDLVDLYGWHVFAWKIPNLSSIPKVVDYVVQSPVFRYQSTSWFLKMYPYGQTQYHTEGYIDVIIENLNSPHLRFLSKMCCRNSSNEESNHKSMELNFDAQFKCARVHQFMPSPQESKLNNPFTLVFEFRLQDFQVKSAESFIDEQHTLNRKKKYPEIGEIINEHSALSFWWKVYNFPANPPADYHAPSAPFSFANASWILKAFPCYGKDSRERNVRAVLERLDSEISEQSVTFKVCLQLPFQKTSSGCYVFNSSLTQAEVLQFSYDPFFRFTVELKVKNTDVAPGIVDDKNSESSMMLPKTKLLQDIKDLFFNQEDCDVIFKVKEQEFLAHKLILKARSPVLASAFRNDMKEKATGVINIEDCDPAHFSDFLYFLYSGEVESLTAENVFSLFTVADKYDVPDLRNLCMEFMKRNLSIDNFCDAIAVALLHSEAELIKLSTEFFAKNLQKIIVTVKWQTFITENPIQGNELLIKALVQDKN